MKIRIFLLLILSSVFVSLAQGSGNCCGIQVGGVQNHWSEPIRPC